MKRALVVTTINKPTEGMKLLARGAWDADVDFYIIGDLKTPHIDLFGSRYLSLEAQRQKGFKLAGFAPLNSYTRKNIGYLLAMRDGADVITETDDDNVPMETFWDTLVQRASIERIIHNGWINIYGNFTVSNRIWPRGLPLDEMHSYGAGTLSYSDCPIQQGLANGDPDVDAIYRLVNNEAVSFCENYKIALGSGAWCPFNSQNTTWFRDAFPLMYLPSTCTFRMTDIWRSFVAQRILWAQGQNILFHSPTVVQKRNTHDLMDDFRQEVPGYLNNKRIAEGLMSLSLIGSIPDSMKVCYEWFVQNNLLDEKELALLDYWLMDISGLGVK